MFRRNPCRPEPVPALVTKTKVELCGMEGEVDAPEALPLLTRAEPEAVAEELEDVIPRLQPITLKHNEIRRTHDKNKVRIDKSGPG